MIVNKTHTDLKEVLMEPNLPGVKNAYSAVAEDNNTILIISSGKNGSEYNKTYGYFHSFQGVEICQCLYGQGVLVMQRNDEDGEAKEFKIVTLHAGKQVVIPAGFGHCLINIGKNFLVVLNSSMKDSVSNNEKLIKDKKGFAYYVVEKKGEVGFDMNPNYRVHPQISTE